MKKEQIMECFDTFFKKYPEKRFISENRMFSKNRMWGMKHVSEQYISKQYLNKEEIEEWDLLPEMISVYDLCNLNEKYNNTLKWQLIPSSLKENDINAFEEEMGVKFPLMFREYLLSHASLLNDIIYV